MNTVIESLYNMQMDGRLDKFMEQYRTKKEDAFQGYLALKKQLSEKQAEELEAMMESHLDILSLELEECFAEGFKLGAKLMCEVFMKEEMLSEAKE